MKTMLRIAGLALAAGTFFSGGAYAQATRTWVSGNGDDVNPCSHLAPCKTFAGAIGKTAAGGIINCKDPGGYGAVNITKSLTIDCYWQSAAGILAAGTYGVQVNAGANDKVVLRGLEIDGFGQGTDGVRILSAGAVQIDHVRIAGFNSGTASGIRVATTSTPVHVHVKDTHILNNGAGATGGGIVLASTGAVDTRVVLSRVEMRDNSFGLDVNGAAGASGYVQVTGSDVVVAGNRMSGVRSTGGGSAASVFLDRATIASNVSFGAFAAGANANVILGRSTVAANGAGVGTSAGGSILSYGTNQINANGSDGTISGGLMER